MELHLALALSTSSQAANLNLNHDDDVCTFHKKRKFSQLVDQYSSSAESSCSCSSSNQNVNFPTTLSLLPLTPAAGHESNPNHHQHRRSHCSPITKSSSDEDNEEAHVGWPPMNYWRKKLCYVYGEEEEEEEEVTGENDDDKRQCSSFSFTSTSTRAKKKTSLYVKVKMEGIGIARKVDLTMHRSFHTLNQTLMDMFGKCQQQLNSYELAYQDKDGDWLLAQDVSWRSFIQCAQRLKLLKICRG